MMKKTLATRGEPNSLGFLPFMCLAVHVILSFLAFILSYFFPQSAVYTEMVKSGTIRLASELCSTIQNIYKLERLLSTWQGFP